MSRRDEMLEAALSAFASKGYDGTSIADLADATGLSKAAFSYHFTSKDDLLTELAGPLLSDLEDLVADRVPPRRPEQLRTLLDDYSEILLRHRTVAIWMDGDKSVDSHPAVGKRLRENNRRMRILIAGEGATPATRIGASSVLGAIWRPIRNLTDIDVSEHKDELVSAALEGFQIGERR